MDEKNIFIFSLLYIIVGIVFIFFILKKSKTFSPAYKGLSFGILFYYIIIPIIVLLNVEGLHQIEIAKGKYCIYTVQRFVMNNEEWKFIYVIFIVMLGFLFFNLFYTATNKIKIKEFDSIKTIKIVKTLLIITFSIGTISLVILMWSFGGIKNALSYAESLRAFNSDASEIIGNNTIFVILARLITVSPFMIVYLIENTPNKKLIYKILLIISIVLSLIYFLFNAGRAPLLAFLLCFAYIIIQKKVKRPWLIIILSCIVALPILDILDSLFYYFNTKTFIFKEINYLKYISQFTYPYKNTLAMTDMIAEYGLKYGLDFIGAFLDFLPGVHFEASYVNTSRFMVGYNWRELGGIPNDFITFGYLQFSFIGVILVSSILGILLKIVDKKLSNFEDNTSKYLFSSAVSIYVFLMIQNFDTISLLKGGWILNSILIIVLLSSRKEE